ncbi:MAG: LysR family transcriptional regulator [Deltaproteobacteria bacterium]|nr:LysR family transcriptional regulator [Deltaproteobacteria bacterium]MDQ3298778.1 LysR family transcriptional regulator [Myxococcota bacterium]
MERVEEWRTFTIVAELRSFSQAARRLRRSPQAITRAVAAVEARLATRLLHRTTRSVSLTADGERYLERARRALVELDALESADDDAVLRGTLAVTAPVLFGQLHLLPVVAGFLEQHRETMIRLALLDRVVSLAEEAIDVGVRIGELPDSSLIARRLGHVRTVICASPAYLEQAGTPRNPDALAKHACIAFTATSRGDRWMFPGPRREYGVAIHARLAVNTAQAAIDAAVAGHGLVRVLSYQVDRLVAERALRIVLPGFEPPPVPVHLVHLPGVRSRIAMAFLERAGEELAKRLGQTLPAVTPRQRPPQ